MLRSRRIEPQHEANTSRYVHEVFVRCFEWPFEAIVPQASKRGFIDYKLAYARPSVDVHVEVKPFDAPLRDEMIRKYIVRPGRMSEGFQVGVLTNLRDWQVFVAGPSVRAVAGQSMALLRWQEIETQADIDEIGALIGHRQNGSLKNIRAAIGESSEVIEFLLRKDDDVAKAIRRVLLDKRDSFGVDARVPQYAGVREFVDQLLDGEWRGDCPFSRAKFRAAVCSEDVAIAIDDRVFGAFGGRSVVTKIRREVRALVDGPREE